MQKKAFDHNTISSYDKNLSTKLEHTSTKEMQYMTVLQLISHSIVAEKAFPSRKETRDTQLYHFYSI